MSSKIVGWLVEDWDGKFQILKKNLKEKKIFWNKSEKGESYIFADWCTRCQALSLYLIMLRVKCRFENLSKMFIILFSPIFMNFWREKLMLIPTLSYMLHIYFISIITNVDFADILLMDGDVTQNDFENLIRMSQIQILFLLLGFQKHKASNHPLKNTLGLFVLKCNF